MTSTTDAPTRLGRLLDSGFESCERHARPLLVLGAAMMLLAAVAPAGGFVASTAIVSSTVSLSGGAIGVVSRYRGWTDDAD